MPTFRVPEQQSFVSDTGLLVDTNVLVRAFAADEEGHDFVFWFLEEFWQHPLYVTIPVITETWGFLVGKKRRLDWGYAFLAWIQAPGRVQVISYCSEPLAVASKTREFRVDFVDAAVMHIANDISEGCGLKNSLCVATYDLNDFVRWVDCGLRFRIYDIQNDEVIEQNPA